MATRPKAYSVTVTSEQREQSPEPEIIGLKQASPVPIVRPEEDGVSRLGTDRRGQLANAWEDVIQRTGTDGTDSAFPSRFGSVGSASNMVILDNYGENLMTAKRMQTFASAFPSRAATAKSVVERIETMALDLDFTVTPASKGSVSSMIKPTHTMAMLRRPSALPEAAAAGSLQWRNVNIFVGDKDDGKQVLHGFTGEVASGELLAVMGGSGAGKSTLLDALSGRSNLNQLTVEGELAINGHKLDITNQELIQSICTFVPQSDILCPTQTVEEALQFYARLKLASKSEEIRQKRINYLIDVLHLESCRHTLIGDERKRGISGGEKRRCSIAAELLSDADILFLDEPTSGLDAYTAARTIKTLKQFCLISNKMVIATIHQPAVEVFYLFDKLILLGAGRCCFQSAINDVDTYFADKIKPTQNPADVVIYEAQRKPDHYADRWAKDHELNAFSSSAAAIQRNDAKWNRFETINLGMIRKGTVAVTDNSDRAKWLIQFTMLLRREVRALCRDYKLSLLRILQIIFLGAFVGTVYFQMSERIELRSMYFGMAAFTALMFALVTTVSAFPSKKLLFQRENASGNYTVTPWAFSFQIIEIPRELALMALYTVIVVMMAGAHGTVWQFVLVYALTNFAGGSVGILCGAIAKSTKEAALILPVPLIFMLFLGDIVVPLDQFPAFIQPLAELNPLYISPRILMVIEWSEYEPYYKTFNSVSFREFCSFYNQYQESQAAEEQLRARTEGMDCSEMIIEVYSEPLYPAVDPSEETYFCQTNITNTKIYNTLGVDPDLVGDRIVQLAAIAVIIRVLAVAILYVINRDGIDWLRKRLTLALCWQCAPSLCRCCKEDKSELEKVKKI